MSSTCLSQLTAREAYLERLPPNAQDLAGLAFLRLLRQLRVSFLQDIIHWKSHIPSHFLWSNSLFTDPEFLDFESQALAQSVEQRSNFGIDVQRILPQLSSQLQAAQNAQSQQLNSIIDRLQGLEVCANSTNQHHSNNQLLLANLIHALSQPIVIPGPLSQMQLPSPTNNPQSTSSSLQLDPLSQSHSPVEPLHGSQPPNPQAPQAPMSPFTRPPPINKFQMSRKIETVLDLWREYTEGLAGYPSVKVMYEGEDTSWKKNNKTERRFYQRRKVILDGVEEIAAYRKIPGREAAIIMDQYRVKQGNTTLNKLGSHVAEIIAREEADAQVGF